ncbi:MAG: recombination mediator RecR [Parascardovia denticolens]
MAIGYEGAIQNVIDRFASLPGIGPKGAQRIAFHLLSVSQEDAQALAESILTMKEKVRFCEICGNVCESSPCPICLDPRRDRTIICVVQEPKDIMSLERTHEYRGLYHVLGGAIDPMADVGPQDLHITDLLNRLKTDEGEEIKEIIFALNPDIEGEATTTYLSRLLEPLDIKLTRLASGLPMGSDLEYADEITLGRALSGRQAV